MFYIAQTSLADLFSPGRLGLWFGLLETHKFFLLLLIVVVVVFTDNGKRNPAKSTITINIIEQFRMRKIKMGMGKGKVK